VEVPVQRLFAKIGELTVLLDLANERITALEAAAATAATAEEPPVS
jgi:hypothetical protein